MARTPRLMPGAADGGGSENGSSALGIARSALQLDGVGIGHAQSLQHGALHSLHGLGLAVVLMIVAQKMQNTMHCQM